MSANFWTSSHCLRWLVDEAAMKAANADRAAQEQGQLSAAGLSRLREYFVETVQMLGKKILRRSAVIATAIVYFKRFYLKTSFTEFDPILMVPTAVYLAAKVEEHHVRVMDVISAYKKLAMGQGAPRKALATGGGRSRVPGLLARHVLEAEKVLLQRLDFDLVVFHPYGPLEALMADMGERVQQSCLQIAWTVVNDSYHTDVCLLFPPFMIALSAIYISCVYVEYDIKQWLNKLHVNEDEVRKVNVEIIRLYDRHTASSSAATQDVGPLIHKLLRVVPAFPGPSPSSSPPPPAAAPAAGSSSSSSSSSSSISSSSSSAAAAAAATTVASGGVRGPVSAADSDGDRAKRRRQA